jgi:hypothetical protein
VNVSHGSKACNPVLGTTTEGIDEPFRDAAIAETQGWRAVNPHVSPGGVVIAGTISAKLLRAFAGQAEALAKLRRPAEQVVRVERVNVAAGGQAIVGAVTHKSRDRGSPENQDQPYGTEDERAREPAADAPVWSQEAGRLALSEVESQGPEPLSAARRCPRKRHP